MITVEKRDGSVEALSTQKIKQVIAWATEGLEVNPLKLESACLGIFTDGVSTNFIQQSLINAASSFASVDEPDWTLVAGRLEVMNRWKETRRSRGFAYFRSGVSTFPEFVRYMVSKGRYDQRLLQFDLAKAGTWLSPQRDLDFTLGGANLLSGRYLLQEELPQEMFLAIALMLAIPEPEEKRMYWAERFYYVLSTRKISLATPVLGNLRVPNSSLASCFTMAVVDDLGSEKGSITDIWRDAALISQNGGGLGISISAIRAQGSELRGIANRAKGIVPLTRVLNDIAVYIDQGGKRAGAFTIALDAWHLDLLDFLELQTMAGDERSKAQDIFPQVVIPDLLMRRAQTGGLWKMFCPHEVRKATGKDITRVVGKEFEELYELCEKLPIRKKTIDAKELLKKIVRTCLQAKGTPYWAFKDRMNEYNPNPHEGIIPLVNLCVAPETRILTDKGQLPIGELEGQEVNVWNGEEWSEVRVKKTGIDRPLVKVIFDQVTFGGTNYLNCTPDHRFMLKDGSEVRAEDLKSGQELVKFEYPVFWEGDVITKQTISGIKIDSVVPLSRSSDVFCFNEPKRHMGVFNGILSMNCIESFSTVIPGKYSHVCCLASNVLTNIEDGELRDVTSLGIRILDNVTTLSVLPTPSTHAHANHFRTVGLGMMGLADWLAARDLNYYSGEKRIEELTETMAHAAFETNIQLGEERGNFPAHEGSQLWKGIILGKLFGKVGTDNYWVRASEVDLESVLVDGRVSQEKVNQLIEELLERGDARVQKSQHNWTRLVDGVKNHARCSQLMSPAPNTSTAIIMGAVPSILPIFKRDGYIEKNTAFFGKYIKEKYWHYTENIHFDQQKLVDIVSLMQRWIDTGISMEFLFNFNELGADAPEKIYNTYIRAWEKGCKAIYYTRQVTKQREEVCSACSG